MPAGMFEGNADTTSTIQFPERIMMGRFADHADVKKQAWECRGAEGGPSRDVSVEDEQSDIPARIDIDCYSPGEIKGCALLGLYPPTT